MRCQLWLATLVVYLQQMKTSKIHVYMCVCVCDTDINDKSLNSHHKCHTTNQMSVSLKLRESTVKCSWWKKRQREKTTVYAFLIRAFHPYHHNINVDVFTIIFFITRKRKRKRNNVIVDTIVIASTMVDFILPFTDHAWFAQSN